MNPPIRDMINKATQFIPKPKMGQSEGLSLVIEKSIETTEEIKLKVINALGYELDNVNFDIEVGLNPSVTAGLCINKINPDFTGAITSSDPLHINIGNALNDINQASQRIKKRKGYGLRNIELKLKIGISPKIGFKFEIGNVNVK